MFIMIDYTYYCVIFKLCHAGKLLFTILSNTVGIMNQDMYYHRPYNSGIFLLHIYVKGASPTYAVSLHKQIKHKGVYLVVDLITQEASQFWLTCLKLDPSQIWYEKSSNLSWYIIILCFVLQSLSSIIERRDNFLMRLIFHLHDLITISRKRLPLRLTLYFVMLYQTLFDRFTYCKITVTNQILSFVHVVGKK